MKVENKEPITEPVKPEEPKKEPVKEPVGEPVKEPKKEEPAKEPKKEPVDSSKEIEELKATISDLEVKAGTVDTVTLENENLKGEINTLNTQLKDYEELVSNLVNTKLEQIPAKYKELIPDNLDLKQKLNWLNKAESKGLFDKEEKKAPAVEIGKPMNFDTDNSVDTTKLSGSQLLKLAYNSIKK